jgi:Ca2+-binding RTX toxin-like protein
VANFTLIEPLKIDSLYKSPIWSANPTPVISNGLSLVFANEAGKIAFTGNFQPAPIIQIMGTVTGIDIYGATGTELLKIDGLNLDVIKSISLIKSPSQPQSLLSLIQNDILGKDDVFNGSAKGDKVLTYQGNDIVNGLGGDDALYGGVGNDTLNGGDGNDKIFGAVGNDVISGGAGKDILTGASGKDTFVFGMDDSTATATDVITDFNAKADHIDLTDLKINFADLTQTVADSGLLVSYDDFAIQLTGVSNSLAETSFIF